MPILNRAAELQDEVTAWRRHIHQNPELNYDVVGTASFVAEQLRAFRHLVDKHLQEHVKETKSNANESQNERHYQDSDQNDSESESSEKMQEDHAAQNGLALEHVLMAAPDVLAYSRHPIRNWRDLMEVSAFVVPMLGITMDVWSEARKQLGDDAASVAIACILQQADRIRRPGAYLRVLVRKAVSASFNAAAMVESLLFRQRVQGFELTAVNKIPRR